MNCEQKTTLARFYALDGAGLAACDFLYELARGCDAPVVHLGGGQSCVSVVLAYGTHDGQRVTVYVVSPDLRSRVSFWRRVNATGVSEFIRRLDLPIRRAARGFRDDVGLVVWDMANGPDLIGDFGAWKSKVVDGGLFAVHGDGLAFSLLVDHASSQGWQRGPCSSRAGVWTLRKCGKDDDIFTPEREERRTRSPRRP